MADLAFSEQVDLLRHEVRALAKVLLVYGDKGFDTVHKIIDRWAPPVEHNTGAYIAAVV